jgi:hypothetical protein
MSSRQDRLGRVALFDLLHDRVKHVELIQRGHSRATAHPRHQDQSALLRNPFCSAVCRFKSTAIWNFGNWHQTTAPARQKARQ